jgi:hypothetical protein
MFHHIITSKQPRLKVRSFQQRPNELANPDFGADAQEGGEIREILNSDPILPLSLQRFAKNLSKECYKNSIFRQ